MKEIYN